MNYKYLVLSIKQNEGFKSKPYIDPLAKKEIPKDELAIIEKYWDKLNITIGNGRCLQTNPLTVKENDYLMKQDILKNNKELFENIKFYANLPDHVRNVLIEMAYQLGVNGLLKFKKTLEHINNKDFEKASMEMLNSKWAKQTPNRAKTLSNLMKGGN